MKSRRRGKTIDPLKETSTVIELIEDADTVCNVCEAEFLDEDDLKVHISQMHMNEPNGKTICKLCCAVLSNDEAFVSHFIFKHLESLVFCFYCYRAYEDPLLLEEHEVKHCAIEDNSIVTCSQCCKILEDRHDLQIHECVDHGNSDDGYMLNRFFSLLSSALNININKFLDYLCKKTPFTCIKCNYKGMYANHYINHLKTTNCRSYACNNCFNVYKKKHSIKMHMRNHLECHMPYGANTIIQKQCPKCEMNFDIQDIADHTAACAVIKCTSCDKFCNSLYDLTDHRMAEHQVKVTLEICKFCRKEFVGVASLRKHIERAHKDKSLYKYNCVYCGVLFTHPSKLFAHFFTCHKSINPYTCKICNKEFRLRKRFTIHIKVTHKSVGFVEFDENLHAIFTDKKSENPIQPKADLDGDSIYGNDSESDDSEVKINISSVVSLSNDEKAEERDNNPSVEDSTNNSTSLNSYTHIDFYTPRSMEVQEHVTENNTIEVEVERLESPPKIRLYRKTQTVQIPEPTTVTVCSPNHLSDDYDDEPLSIIRESILKQKTQNLVNLKKRMAIRNKRAKLTCKICNKYCYTVQNYHHHTTLHQKRKLKKCIKCHKYFNTRKQLKSHMGNFHSSSKLTETLRSLLEKRKQSQPGQKSGDTPSESLKSLLEKRKKAMINAQTRATCKFQHTIKKVDVTNDCVATITPMTDHGLSVKNFIENFKPETDNLSISNCVTIKTITKPVDKQPIIKLKQFTPETYEESNQILRFPVKFKEPPTEYLNTNVTVTLVQQLITKPKLVNMTLNEKIPAAEEKTQPEEYCNMFASDKDYTQYKNDNIPDVGREVMLPDTDHIPRTKRLEQEILIPNIPKGHGNVRIGHLLPQAPFYKIVSVTKLLSGEKNEKTDEEGNEKNIKLPDGTQLVTVKNPYSHLIPTEHLDEILKANKTRYYKPKSKNNIEQALAKALRPPKPTKKSVATDRRVRKKNKSKS